MKNILVLAIAAGVLVATAAAPRAVACNNFDVTTGDWGVNDNWSAGHKPTSTEEACIASDQTVTVRTAQGNQTCAAIHLDGIVIVQQLRTLTITGDNTFTTSNIDGTLKLQQGGAGAGGKPHISGALTIKGVGGDIVGLSNSTGSAAILSTSAHLLTTFGAGGDNTSRSNSLVIHGLLNISADLENDAFVVADDDTLTLSGVDKEGDGGFWIAENGATLDVGVGVTGDNTWQLVDDADSVIHFFTDTSTSLGGDFEIEKGTLDVDANIATSGHLTFQTVSGSRPRIDVADNVSALWFP